MDAIVLDDVCKSFRAHQAVDGLSLAVPRGSIYGFIGPNGSGKTTTLRMILHILHPDRGSIEVLGSTGRRAANDRIGYLPEERGLYKKMKVLELLTFLGTIRGLSPGESKRRSASWLDRFELGDWATHKAEDLSKGMQQKVQIIGALLHEPQLLILDEPFSGLDPINTRALKDLLLAMAGEGVTIVLSTHVLPQVDEMCTHICLINRARAILTGALSNIRNDYGGNIWRISSDVSVDALTSLDQVTAVRPLGDELLVELAEGKDSRTLLRELVAAGNVESFTRFVPDLENIFLRAVEEDRSNAA
jgi:ABC-2 type transport system ATP-binding protein